MNFLCYFIMLNLFTMVTIQQYEEFNAKEENPIEKFSDMVSNFKDSWNKYSLDKDKGHRIKIKNLINFFIDLNGDLSVNYDKNMEEIKKYISELNLLKYIFIIK